MFKMLGAALVAVSLACAGSAAATVLYSESGSFNDSEAIALLPPWNYDRVVYPYHPQPIRISFDYVATGDYEVSTRAEYSVIHTWWGGAHSEITESVFFTPSDTSYSDILTTFSPRPGGFDIFVRPQPAASDCWPTMPDVDLCVHEEVRYLDVWASGQGQFTYQFTISTIPEPGAWALLIVGFGLMGSALRHRQRSHRGQVFPLQAGRVRS